MGGKSAEIIKQYEYRTNKTAVQYKLNRNENKILLVVSLT